MRFCWSLQTRFVLATSVLVVVLCAAFAVAVHHFVELLEDELLNRALVQHMQQFKLAVAADTEATAPAAAGLRGFIVRSRQDEQALPPELTPLSRGVHEDVLIGERMYYVAVDDVKSIRLYLLLDTERVDVLERNVITVALLVGIAALGLAAIFGVALSRAVTRLQQVLEREQLFTEDASHELRTPLAIISSATELLTDEPTLSEAGRERLARVRRASGQMQSLIEALLFLARSDSGTSSQHCALDQIVTEAAKMIAGGAAAKSLELRVNVVPVTVTGAPVMVACVVNNLLLNAVNYTQSGTITVHLTPTALLVSDTGIGIPPEDLSHIFERRYRGSHSRGLGLGLYLVSRICQRLGWQIDTRSAHGAGTTFRIQL
jgi:signal transduction histidine kinase